MLIKMNSLTLRVSPGLKARLLKEAARRKVSVSTLVRDILAEKLPKVGK